MMELALMRTATGKEDPELPLLQRISLFELTAPQIATHIMLYRVQMSQHLNFNCSEETV